MFETGRVFAVSGPSQLPHEREAFALVATGGAMEADRADASRELNFFDLKGALESANEAMNLPALDFEVAAVKHLQPGQSAAISTGGRRVGSIGRLAEAVAAAHKFRQLFSFRIDRTLFWRSKNTGAYFPTRFPSIGRESR